MKRKLILTLLVSFLFIGSCAFGQPIKSYGFNFICTDNDIYTVEIDIEYGTDTGDLTMTLGSTGQEFPETGLPEKVFIRGISATNITLDWVLFTIDGVNVGPAFYTPPLCTVLGGKLQGIHHPMTTTYRFQDDDVVYQWTQNLGLQRLWIPWSKVLENGMRGFFMVNDSGEWKKVYIKD